MEDFFSRIFSFRKLKVMELRFEVLRAMSKKMAVFWDVATCGLVDTGRRFRGAYYLHH
jgi:hypothetical protein